MTFKPKWTKKMWFFSNLIELQCESELSCNRMTSSCRMYNIKCMNVNINIDRDVYMTFLIFYWHIQYFNALSLVDVLLFFTYIKCECLCTTLRYNFDMIFQSSPKRTKIIEKWNFLEEEDVEKKCFEQKLCENLKLIGQLIYQYQRQFPAKSLQVFFGFIFLLFFVCKLSYHKIVILFSIDRNNQHFVGDTDFYIHLLPSHKNITV